MADNLLKGCRVRLSGLSTSLLNGAEGCIAGPLDEETGRHPVKLLKPFEAVSAFPGGVKVKPVNLERVVVAAAPSKKATAKKTSPKDKGQAVAQAAPGSTDPFDPAAWAKGLSPNEKAEWLVDCYRMRVDDDCIHGGCNMHGLYDPDHTGDTIAADFLVFCKLALQQGVVGQGWDWGKCLGKAAELLGYAFEKSDAQDKYGSENIFAVVSGGRSLRMTAEFVYGTSCMAGEESDAHSQVRELVESEPFEELFHHQPDLFADVGVVALWKRLRAKLRSAQ